jgi:hypothetical protein
VVKKKLDAEAVAPGLAVGVKTVIVIQRARSARNILLFIFLSPFLDLKGCCRRTSSKAMSPKTKKKKSEHNFFAV